MGTIKFRAWDKVNKKMIYNEYSSGISDYDIVISLEGNIYRPADHCTDCCDKHLGDICSESDLILLQYTGLKDKNGKEIYQGDIIKSLVVSNKEYHGKFTYEEVIKIHGQWIVSHIKSDKGNLPKGYLRGFLLDKFDYDAKLFLWGEDYKPYTDLEIIGNIYENPELLKSK